MILTQLSIGRIRCKMNYRITTSLLWTIMFHQVVTEKNLCMMLRKKKIENYYKPTITSMKI